MKTVLTIIIVNYNTRDLTLECLESIKKSGFQKELEILVVDNNSTDGSQEAIRRYLNKITGVMLKVALIKNKENLGYAKANNRGIRKAKGDCVLLLNSDTLVKKSSLEKMIEFAAMSRDAGVVGPKLLNIDGTDQPSTFHFPTLGRAIAEYWLGKKGTFGLYVPEGEYPSEVDGVVGAASLITPRALQGVGLLDERYFMYFEDLDYCRRVWKSGLKVYYQPEAEIVHYHGASGRNLVKPAFQWKRLIPSSKIYHGIFKHYLINFIIWSGQKWQRILKNF